MSLKEVEPTTFPNIFILVFDYAYSGVSSNYVCVLNQLRTQSSCAFVRADFHCCSFRLNVFLFSFLEVCWHFKHVPQECVWRTTVCTYLFINTEPSSHSFEEFSCFALTWKCFGSFQRPILSYMLSRWGMLWEKN